MPRDEFYIGYLPKAPPKTARFRSRVVAVVLLLAFGVVALVASTQKTLPPGTFEFGVDTEVGGLIATTATPILLSRDHAYLLVGVGKFGWTPPDEPALQVTGSVIEANGLQMIEVHETTPGDAASTEADFVVERDSVTLFGELVDTKCYLGVMRPATGKVHRACAVRCLSGGIPPGLLVRIGEGESRVYVLEGSDGGQLDYDVQWAGLTVRVEGTIGSLAGVPILRATQLARYDE